MRRSAFTSRLSEAVSAVGTKAADDWHWLVMSTIAASIVDTSLCVSALRTGRDPPHPATTRQRTTVARPAPSARWRILGGGPLMGGSPRGEPWTNRCMSLALVIVAFVAKGEREGVIN